MSGEMTTLEITPTGQVCGALVRGVDFSGDVDAETVAEIRAAWLEHHVLAFPDQGLTDDDLDRFTLLFGPHGDDPFFESIEGHPHIAALHRLADETASIFADTWHADWSFQEYPPIGTCLYAKVIPPEGGNTLFADQHAAYAAMPEELRARIEGLTVVHSAKAGYSPDGLYGDADADSVRAMKIIVSDAAYETQTHPLVRPHTETGEPVPYGTFGYIFDVEGMAADEARDLLVEVYRWQTKDEFVYEHRWEPNMLVMWDNRSVLHKATGGYDGYERLLLRTTIGDPRTVAA
jgi:taurine dioxygenase